MSLFIRTLCDILTEPNLVKQFDISELLIIVLNRVSKIKVEIDSQVSYAQMPCFHMQLRKFFKFSIATATTVKEFYTNLSLPRLSFGGTNEYVRNSGNMFWPNGVCFNSNTENLLISDGGHDRIIFFSKKRIFLKAISDKVSRPHGLCIWRDKLISSQWHGNCITYHSLDTGRCILEFGASGKSHGNFNRPTRVDFCSGEGNLYVCDLNNNRVQIFDLGSTKFKHCISKLYEPQDVHIYNQNIYFLDKGNPCMHIYSLQHNLVRQIISRADYTTSTDCQQLAGWFFCIDWSGNILVPDYYAHCIKIFSERGKLI